MDGWMDGWVGEMVGPTHRKRSLKKRRTPRRLQHHRFAHGCRHVLLEPSPHSRRKLAFTQRGKLPTPRCPRGGVVFRRRCCAGVGVPTKVGSSLQEGLFAQHVAASKMLVELRSRYRRAAVFAGDHLHMTIRCRARCGRDRLGVIWRARGCSLWQHRRRVEQVGDAEERAWRGAALGAQPLLLRQPHCASLGFREPCLAALLVSCGVRATQPLLVVSGGLGAAALGRGRHTRGTLHARRLLQVRRQRLAVLEPRPVFSPCLSCTLAAVGLCCPVVAVKAMPGPLLGPVVLGLHHADPQHGARQHSCRHCRLCTPRIIRVCSAKCKVTARTEGSAQRCVRYEARGRSRRRYRRRGWSWTCVLQVKRFGNLCAREARAACMQD